MDDHTLYDHNQTLVPESFLALYLRHGRLVGSRAEIELRYDLAEDLALHIAALPTAASADGKAEQVEAMTRLEAGLLTPPAQVSGAEAGWIVQRVAELLGWDQRPPPSAD